MVLEHQIIAVLGAGAARRRRCPSPSARRRRAARSPGRTRRQPWVNVSAISSNPRSTAARNSSFFEPNRLNTYGCATPPAGRFDPRACRTGRGARTRARRRRSARPGALRPELADGLSVSMWWPSSTPPELVRRQYRPVRRRRPWRRTAAPPRSVRRRRAPRPRPTSRASDRTRTAAARRSCRGS